MFLIHITISKHNPIQHNIKQHSSIPLIYEKTTLFSVFIRSTRRFQYLPNIALPCSINGFLSYIISIKNFGKVGAIPSFSSF